MAEKSSIFKKNYDAYREQLAVVNFEKVRDTLGLILENDQFLLPFFDNKFKITSSKIVDMAGNEPDYVSFIILAKYLLLCPDKIYNNTEWTSFKDFKNVSHFTNVNYFSSDVEKAIEKHFSGRCDRLIKAGEMLGGSHHPMDISYDVSMRFDALPRISLLLLFNDGDDEFPAKCSVLFPKHAEFYLDPESLAITGAVLSGNLKKMDQSV